MVDAFQLRFNTSDVSLSQFVCGFKSCKSLACVHIASVTTATATTMFWEVYNVNIVIHLAIH
ncbi:hypothetical protein LTSESEN_3860 [Salmonella enterica subsp. enterica serovar Senftenberg str. A4-543]|uniref:Uncharacterized protein n=1 Tax=Salmonella enterica subsp. enterica serovar Senftenberg str. A4-543 TaxID=913082 RepID=G5R327_SALSE|nr:hypothetical protein LTSESEN_3860 [Salmonella enterica subsp. enterica serovar Senftenberg str. A4-543]